MGNDGGVFRSTDGGQTWQILTDDPVGSPVLADADSDGDAEAARLDALLEGRTSRLVGWIENAEEITAEAVSDKTRSTSFNTPSMR